MQTSTFEKNFRDTTFSSKMIPLIYKWSWGYFRAS